MDRQQATAFIARELDKNRSVDEVVRALCAQTGWPQVQVERFVRQVAATHAPPGEVERRQETAAPAPPPQRQLPVEVERPQAVAAPPSPQSESAPPARRRIKLEDEEEAVEFVIYALGRHHHHDDIIRSLCEQAGWPWKQARHFVQRVEVEHQDRIVARQSPVVIMLGVGSIVVGAVIAIYTAIVLIGWISNPEGTDPKVVENMIYYAAGFVTGLAMVVGGVAGVWRAVTLIQEAG